jgi:hypothetical protein
VVYTVVHKQQKAGGPSPSSTSGSGNNSTGSNGGGKNTTGDGGRSPTFQTGVFNPLNPLSPPDPSDLSAKSGASGSTVTTYVNGTKTTFTYVNNFGGSWAVDPMNPWTTGGKAQEWVPSITEEWVWGRDTIRGVNLGGWWVLIV